MATYHLSKAASSDDVACMNKTVQMSCSPFDLDSHIIIDLHVEDICYEVQGILVVLYLRIETSEVEAVSEIIFVDLAEIFIAPR